MGWEPSSSRGPFSSPSTISLPATVVRPHTKNLPSGSVVGKPVNTFIVCVLKIVEVPV